AKGAGAGLSKIGDITKGLKGVGNIDIPTLPDGSVHLPNGNMMDPNGNLISPNGSIDTTPVHYETNTPSAPHGTTTPTLPAHWTIQGAQQPVATGVHTGADAAAHTVDNAGHYNTPPNAGHYNAPPAAATHTPGGGAYDATPSPGSYDQAPSGSPYGQAPSGSPYGQAPSPSAYDHAPSPSAYDHAPSPSAYDQTPTTTPHTGGAGHPGPATPWYHQDAAAPAHDVPTTTPHTGGPDVPGTGGHGTPDTPHGTGHDTPGAGHADDASHGAGHGDDGVGHADDAAHAGDHTDIGDAAAHHGTDAPVAPGHQGADLPGSGAGEPFEYKPAMSRAEFEGLSDAQKHAVAMEELARGTNPAPSVSNQAGLAYGNSYWNQFLDDLPADSREALRTYSGNEYDLINGHLRFGNPVDDSLMHTIGEMDKVMGARPVPEDIMIVRGTGVDHIRIDGRPLKSPLEMEGGVFDDKAYTSTALGKTPPPPFDQKPVHMHLRVAKDTPALWIDHLSKYPGERELLLASGSKYKVTRVFMDEADGKWHVYGEVLPRP
ncbi:ADP-ribosyltransferase, partial [Streptomyces resistomycificus]